jgi:hypothetical protein
MARPVTIWALGLALIACGQALGGEPERPAPPGPHFLSRLSPVGGWDPDGGGLLHWWNRDCFPRICAPDDYCRKPPPRVCWPRYSPVYTWGPLQSANPPSHGSPDLTKPH